MQNGYPEPLLAIIWHSRTGASEAMANAAAVGAGQQARLLRARETLPEHLLDGSAYLFVCPANLGSMSGEMKEMFDRCYYPLLERIEGRSYATAISAGTSGHGTEAQIDRIVTGWRLHRVAESVIVNLKADCPETILSPKTPQETELARCQDLGNALATGLRLGIF